MADSTPIAAGPNAEPNFAGGTPSAPTVAEIDLTGRQLGQYQILRRLGRGGMAEVYLAEQTTLRRQVAIKVLKATLARDESYVRRFHNEAQAVASLVHANIVQIYEVGCVDGIHFIAQEYVPGQNLRQLIARGAPVSVSLAVSILRQAGAALQKAGEQGIIHRDIKPENLLLAPTIEMKIADFGLARIAGNAAEMNLTQVGVAMGTPLYMSPEQVESRPLDSRSDLYSLGVTMYHLLARRPPYEGETALAIALQHLNKQPEPLAELRPDLPPELCRIVHKMLAKSPDDRYQKASELLRDVRALPVDPGEMAWPAGADGESFDSGAYPIGRLEATQRLESLMKAEPRWEEGRNAWPVVAAVLAAFALGGVGAWLSRDPPLLSPPRFAIAEQVERQDSAEAQYIYAMLLNTEAAWRSVAEFFPPEEGGRNRYYAHRAAQQLGRLYLQREEFDKAQRVFQQLAQLEASEPEFKAFGIAGLALVAAARQDNQSLAQQILTLDRLDLRDKLQGDMRIEIDRLLARRGAAPPPPD